MWANKIDHWMQEHWDGALDWLTRYVQADSTQGNERIAQKLVADKLNQLGLEVEVWELDGEQLKKHDFFYSPREVFHGSPNVVGRWKGCGGGRSILLNGHVDVVPVGDIGQWAHAPFSGVVLDGKMYGRGVTDMKGGNLASIYAIECLRDLGVQLKGDVVFHSVVEEESGGAGTLAALLAGYTADAAIIPEPTHMRIFPKQQGSMWFRILIKGRSAHGGTRYKGISAIEKCIPVLAAIQELERKRNERVIDPLYQNTPIPVPINIGMIQGGEWPSSVPDFVKLEGRMGVLPEERMESAKMEMQAAIDQLSQEDNWFKQNPLRLEWFGARWLPGSIDVEHSLMKYLRANYSAVMGSEPTIEASPWGTDGGLLTQLGNIPTIVFGPGITEVAHFPNEYVELEKIKECSKIIALTLMDWCGE
ncbi:MAG TPA: peptidase [Bacillota bacterium]|nr:peptidase [Bacillota bacterium]